MSDWVELLRGRRFNIATGATLRWRNDGEDKEPTLDWFLHGQEGGRINFGGIRADEVWEASGGTK